MLKFKRFLKENVIDDQYTSSIMYKGDLYYGHPTLTKNMDHVVSMDHVDLLDRIFNDLHIEEKERDNISDQMQFVYFDRKTGKIKDSNETFTKKPIVYYQNNTKVFKKKESSTKTHSYNDFMTAKLVPPKKEPVKNRWLNPRYHSSRVYAS